jgi:hypothetical protein
MKKMMTLSDDEKLQCFGMILTGYAVIKKRKVKKSMWVKKWLLRRSIGIAPLLHELREESVGDYRRYLRIDPATFDVLCLMLQPRIQKADTNCRLSITVPAKLAVTLRYLATGKSY